MATLMDILSKAKNKIFSAAPKIARSIPSPFSPILSTARAAQTVANTRLPNNRTIGQNLYAPIKRATQEMYNPTTTAGKVIGAPGRFLASQPYQTFFTRPAIEIPMSAAEKIGTKRDTFTPTGVLSRSIFGDKPLKSYQNQADTGGVDTLVDFGMDREKAKKFAPYLAVAGIAADITPPGLDDVLKKGAKEVVTNPKVVAGVAKGASKVDDLAKVGAKVVDNVAGKVDEVKDLFKSDVANTTNLTNAVEQAKNTIFQTQGGAKKAYKYMTTQTPEKLSGIFGKDFYVKHLQPIVDTVNVADRKAREFVSTGLDNIAQLASNAGIKNFKDKKALLLSKLRGEGGYQEVVAEVGREQADNLVILYKALRQDYDAFYQAAAPVAESLGKQLPKLEDFLSQQGNKLSGGIDLTGGGFTSEVSSSLFKKQGAVANISPLESYLLYKQKISNLLHLEPVAQKINQLRTALSQNSNTTPEMLSALKKMEDDILGSGKEIAGWQKLLDKYFQIVKKAAVVGKVSTAVNQTLGIPAGAANAGFINTIKGNLNPATRAMVDNSSLVRSVDRQVPKFFRDGNVITQGFENVLGWANKQGYSIPMRGFIEQAKNAGLKNTDEIVQMADREAARVLGDRRAWMTPDFYDTFLGKIFAPFTQEQTAQVTSFIQNIGDKKLAAVVGTLVAWKVGNEAWKKVSGFSPYFDPVGAAQETIELWNGSDKKEQNRLKSFMRVVEEGLTLMPPVQSIVNQLYSIGDSAGMLPDSRDVWANDRTWMSTGSLINPLSNIKIDTKNGLDIQPRPITDNKLVDIGLNVGAKFIPGLEQANRTIQAYNTNKRGYSTTKTGSPMYEAPDNLWEKGKSLLLGQSSTQNARDYFDNDYSRPMDENSSKAYKALPDNQKSEFFNKSTQANQSKLKLDSAVQKETGEGNFWDKIFGGKKDDFAFTPPTNPTDKELKDWKSSITTLKDNGIPIPNEALHAYYLDSETLDSQKTGDARNSFTTKVAGIWDSEDLSDDQKRLLTKAAGLTEAQAEFLSFASMSNEDKRQKLYNFASSTKDRDELMKGLLLLKQRLGGKTVLSTDYSDYLYDMGAISKDEKAYINAVKFDEWQNKYYLDRDYKGSLWSGKGGVSGGSGGSSSLTKADKKALIKLSLEMNELYQKLYQPPKPRQRAAEKTKTIAYKPTTPKRATRKKTGWFTSY